MKNVNVENDKSFNLNVYAAVSVTVIVFGGCFIAWKHPDAFLEIASTLRHFSQAA